MLTSMYRKVSLLVVGLILLTMLGMFLDITDGGTYVPTASGIKQSLKAIMSDGAVKSAVKGYVSLNGEIAKAIYQIYTDNIDVTPINTYFREVGRLTGASSFESLVDKIVNLINIRI